MQTIVSTPAAMRPDRMLAVPLDAGARHRILFFFAAYALAWVPFGVTILPDRGVFELRAPQAVFLALATLGVCLAGSGAAVAESGRAGVRELLAQVFRWRVRPSWYAAALFGSAVLPLLALLLGLILGNASPQLPSAASLPSFPFLLMALFVPALFEEIGWRGYALPRLQGRMGLLAASLVLGVIWAGMHLPLWLLPDFGFAEQSVPLYVVQVTAVSVLLAWTYDGTGRSVLLSGLAHAAINGWPMLWAPWGAGAPR
jgi:membrane protease YdiL (CAAX protease family)